MGPFRFRDQIERSDRWFRETEVRTVLAAAATLLGLEGAEDPAAFVQREVCMDLIRRGESEAGGWGPFAHSPPEVFDTALTLLGLLQFRENLEVAAMLARGRRYLIDMQEQDGGWPETTRPTGRFSYAHRISTSGWAAQALVLTAGQ